MKYKIILKTSHKHFSRIERCMRFWLKDKDVICATDKIVDLAIPQISASNKDTHGVSSEEKTVFMFNYIKNNPTLFSEYDWFMFIDDDAILNSKMLDYILPHLNKNLIYGVNMQGAYPKDTSLIYPSGGAGYLVSRKIIDANPYMINYFYFHEDVSVGRYMRDNNIKLNNSVIIHNKNIRIHMNGWYPFQHIRVKLQQENKPFDDLSIINLINKSLLDNNIIKHLTHHYIKTDECMEYIHLQFSQWNINYLEVRDLSNLSIASP